MLLQDEFPRVTRDSSLPPSALVGGALCQIGKTCLDVIAVIAAAHLQVHMAIVTDKVVVVHDTVSKMNRFLLELQPGTGKISGQKFRVEALTPHGSEHAKFRWQRIKDYSGNTNITLVAAFSSCSQLSTLQAVLLRWRNNEEPAMVLVDEVSMHAVVASPGLPLPQ